MWMCCKEPEIILDDHYGSHQPAVFCEDYWLPLEEQALGHLARVIVRADRAVSVLYNGPDKEELEQLSGEELANLTEAASCAWMDILEKFVPEEGYHLGYIGESQALWMIPNDWHDPDYD